MKAWTSGFDNASKQLLEELFGMCAGYVTDVNNGTFASFVQTRIGFNPYDRYDGSKAVTLRQIWLNEPFADVAKLNLDLLERWRINKLRAGEQSTEFETYALGKLAQLFTVDAALCSRPTIGPSSIRTLQQSTWPRRPMN